MLLFVIFSPEKDTVPATGDNPVTETVSSQEEKPAPEPFSGSGTLASLMNRGESLECTISYQVTNSPAVEGTYFVNDGRIRGDFITTVPEMGGDVLSSLIMADGEMYSWSDIGGQQYGVKVVLSETSEAATTPQGVTPPVPNDATVVYDCRPWLIVDNSIFEPPSSVLFQDYSSVMGAGMEYGTIYNEGE